MPFKVPTFNLTCDIYTANDLGINPPRLADVPCQWRGIAKLTALDSVFAVSGPPAISTEILLPAGTDVRGSVDGALEQEDDIILSVFGVTRPFYVLDVYDVARGFANEYRIAVVRKLPYWAVPIP